MKFAAFTFATGNIGDDVQALAAALFSRRLNALIDRDVLADAPLDAPHACIFNSWFLVGNDFRAPSPRLAPILHGVCIGRDHLMKTPWRDWLAENGPVGARDTVTLELLRGHGIAAEWTGCLTAFMGERLVAPAERRGVLFVDVDAETEARFIPPEIAARAERLTNFVPPAIVRDPLRRLAYALRLMARLARAELVVTRRLHVALPCVGLRTPVCVLPDPSIANARRRFAGYDWLPLRFKDESPAGLDFDWTAPHTVTPPPAMRQPFERLVARLEALGLHAAEPVDPAAPSPPRLVLKGDFPSRPGAVALRLGGWRQQLLVVAWSSGEIEVEAPPLPLHARLGARLIVRDGDGRAVAKAPLSAAEGPGGLRPAV